MYAVVQTLAICCVRLSADIEETLMVAGNILLIVLIMMLVGVVTV